MLKPKPTTGDTTWFVKDRFGMFIHWGPYSALGGEWNGQRLRRGNSENTRSNG